VVMATEVCESPIVSIHYCPTSCSIAFEDLVKLPVKRLSFEECVSDVNHFGEIDFCIEPSSIRYSKRMLAAYPNLKAQRFNVEDSNHIVTGPVGITNLPDSIPTDKVRRRCWKIRLQNSKSNIRYEIGERTHWGLAAMDVNEEGQSDAAVYLECKND